MKAWRMLLVALVAVVLAAGCETNVAEQPKQTAGTVAGAAAGGLLGAQIGDGTGQLAATAAGTLIGALVGGEIGKSLDRADRAYAAQTTQAALETNPTGASSTWRNPDTGHYGTVTPTRTYASAGGLDCREYRHEVVVDGRPEAVYGTACREPDGTWRIANQ